MTNIWKHTVRSNGFPQGLSKWFSKCNRTGPRQIVFCDVIPIDIKPVFNLNHKWRLMRPHESYDMTHAVQTIWFNLNAEVSRTRLSKVTDPFFWNLFGTLYFFLGILFFFNFTVRSTKVCCEKKIFETFTTFVNGALFWVRYYFGKKRRCTFVFWIVHENI